MTVGLSHGLFAGLPDFIEFGRDVCGDLREAERREWWLSNGTGGYAGGTIAGSLTRRYHGLLVAPPDPSLNPPLGRRLVVAKADAAFIEDGRERPLFTNRWHGRVIDPKGYIYIESFRLAGRVPVWRYSFDGICLEHRIWMERGRNTSYVAYRLEPSDIEQREVLKLRVRILINARDHHGQIQPGDFSAAATVESGRLAVSVQDVYMLNITPHGGSIHEAYYWVENFDLPAERERGLPDRDSHLCIGEAVLDLKPGEWAGLVLSLHDDASPDIEAAMERSSAHDKEIIKLAENNVPEMRQAPDWVRQLLLAADSFLFARPVPEKGESVIAGYPWFGGWGRDTMIALPGLTLATGRYDIARRILMAFAGYVDKGMLPNLFPEAGSTPEYNTVDAALWYIEAWRAYIEEAGDLESLKKIFSVLKDIVEWYRRGTRYNIHMDSADLLLYAGEPGVQLSWMDARVDGRVITPRIGKPVEVNALWFNAHMAMAEFAGRLGEKEDGYKKTAIRIKEGFGRFVCPDTGGLYDVLDGPEGPEGDDKTIRPNQVFAVSLAHSPLDSETQKRVVTLCRRHLLCSYGLRSLSPEHGDYRPYYTGGVHERDGGYHQGPVWAWLLGHYALAEYKAYGDAEAAQALLYPMKHHLRDAGLGSISELFDGDPPHLPRGCPSQAWSVACTLEAWWKLERAKREREGGRI